MGCVCSRWSTQYSWWSNGKKRDSNGGVGFGFGNKGGGNNGGNGKCRDAKVHGAAVAMARVVRGEDHGVAGTNGKRVQCTHASQADPHRERMLLPKLESVKWQKR